MNKDKQKKDKQVHKTYHKNKRIEDLVIDTSQITDRNEQNMWMLAIISMLSVFSSYMGFSDGFEIGSSLFLVLAIIALFSVITQFILKDSCRIKIGLPALGIGLGIYVALTSKWIINGFTLITNQIITYVNEHRAEMHIKYVASYETKDLDIALATIAICVIYVIIFNVLLKYRRIFLCVFLLLTGSMINMFVGGEDEFVWVAISLICSFIILYVSNICIFKVRKGISFGSVLLIFLVVISALFVIFVKYSEIRSVDELKDEIIYRAGNVVYGKSDYPEGQFKRFDEVPKGEEDIRLTVDMTNPVPLHLKGYVGCEYTEKGWKGNDENIYGGDNLGMLDWFLEQGFYPLTQPAYYMGYSRNDGRNIDFDKVTNSSIHIVNNTASKKYEYVSENLLDMSGLIDPKQDVNFVETDIFGEEEYWYDILYFMEDDYLKFPSQEWFEHSSTATGEIKQFIQAENYYHGFVSTYYLEIPDEEKEILSQNIPMCSNNVSDAISTVRRYLKSQISYSEECMEYNPDKNYLQQVLLEDKRGYSVHFSTVATLMFRYYGVPARYVEGYWSPNEEEKETVELKDTDAHAWVEVYVKGLGFVPVEVTPGFYQEEEIGGSVVHKKHKPLNQNGGGSTGTKDDEKEQVQITWQMILTAALLLLLLSIVIFVLILIVRRMVIVSGRRKKLASKDSYLVVATASKYIDEVCVFSGSSIKTEISDDIRQILERVKFSKHPLNEDEKDCVYECMKKITEEKWKQQTFGKKLIMMFLKCLK